MKKQKLSEDEIDKFLINLPQSAHSPKGNFSAEESYKMLQERLPKRKVKYLQFSRYASAVAVLLFISLSVYFYKTDGNTEMMTLSTSNQTKEIVLPDGTLVTLNHYSSLKYPAEFTGDTRTVSLEGAGYFEVYKDKEHPFIVRAQDVQVKVLGTHFSIQSYDNDPYVKTTLLEGSVRVSNTQNGNIVVLKPNESAIFDKESALLYQQTKIQAKDDIAWREGKFIFNNIPLSDITRDLSNHFNSKINITDNRLKEYRLTASFENNESLEEILTLLQTTMNFSWNKDSNIITIKPNQEK